MKRKTTAIFLILMVISLFGCAYNINLTQEARYYEAVRWYNDNLELYLTHYGAQTPEVKAEWQAKYHPIFKAGDMALSAWKGKLPQGEQEWIAMKRQILATLLTLNIVEVQQ